MGLGCDPETPRQDSAEAREKLFTRKSCDRSGSRPAERRLILGLCSEGSERYPIGRGRQHGPPCVGARPGLLTYSRRPRIFDSLVHSAEPYCCLFCPRPCAGGRGQRDKSGTVLTVREFRTQQKKPIFIKKSLSFKVKRIERGFIQTWASRKPQPSRGLEGTRHTTVIHRTPWGGPQGGPNWAL